MFLDDIILSQKFMFSFYYYYCLAPPQTPFLGDVIMSQKWLGNTTLATSLNSRVNNSPVPNFLKKPQLGASVTKSRRFLPLRSPSVTSHPFIEKRLSRATDVTLRFAHREAPRLGEERHAEFMSALHFYVTLTDSLKF